MTRKSATVTDEGSPSGSIEIFFLLAPSSIIYAIPILTV
jgi:hypothetical protein